MSPHEESNLRPLDLRSDALPLSHRDSTVSEVYYEVHMTGVLHTARISNVDSVMFVDRNLMKRMSCEKPAQEIMKENRIFYHDTYF